MEDRVVNQRWPAHELMYPDCRRPLPHGHDLGPLQAHRHRYLPPEEPEADFPWRDVILGAVALGLVFFCLFQLPALVAG